MGGCLFNEIPESPQLFDIVYHGNESLQIHTRWINPEMTTHGNPLDTIATILVWRNDSLITTITDFTSKDTLYYTDVVERPDYYRYQICVTDTLGNMGRKLYANEMWFGGNISGIVIWDLDRTPISGREMSAALETIGYEGYLYNTNYSSRYPLESTLDAVFVCLGVFSNNHILSGDEGQRLADYLNSGGNLYMEGGDTWFYDVQTAVHPLFEINAIADGGADLVQVAGEPGSLFDNLYFNYTGENNYIDQIEPTVNSNRILYNPTLNVGAGVAYNSGTYKTIGTSFEFGGLVDGQDPSAKSELMKRMLTFFGVDIVSEVKDDSDNHLIPNSFKISQNYPNPFNNSTTFNVSIPANGRLIFQIYDITGKIIYNNNIGNVSPAVHKINWNGLSNSGVQVASGVYFYRFILEDRIGLKIIQTLKMMLLR